MSVSRRNFIKGGAAGTALGILGGMPLAGKWLRPVSAANDPKEMIAYTYHTPNCGGRCSMKCTIRDGKLVKIEPNDWPDPKHSAICLRGLSEVERLYSPDRLKTPLKRVGERGEGKFVPISWEEALTTVAAKLGDLKQQYGGKSIYWRASSGVEYTMPHLSKLLGAQSTNFGGLDIGVSGGLHQVTGAVLYGPMQVEISDWVNSNLVILIGDNLLETAVTDAVFFYDAKDAGARIISIDPSYTTTASKSDQWISIRPGTDAALIFAMINMVIENKWYKRDYLLKNTTAPCLIREDNEKLLTEKDLNPASETNKLLVWDKATNAVKPYDADGIIPELEGEFTVNGIKVKTVFSGLVEQVKQYTPAWAAEETEIPEETIRNLTKEYAFAGPAVIGWGLGGPDKWYHADTLGRAGGILGALTGNIGRAGSGVGSACHHAAAWNATLGGWKLPPEAVPALPEMSGMELSQKPNSVRALVVQGNVIYQWYANMNRTVEWIKKLDFVVVIDQLHSDSVNYADIVLPACSSFESEYEINNLQVRRSHVMLQQKILDPLFESKSDFEIERLLAEKLGVAQYLPKSPEEYQKARLVSPDPALKGITLEALKSNNYIMRLNVPNEPYRANMNQVYNTPSKKLELYNEVLLPDKVPFPKYEKPLEAFSSNPLLKKYPLQLSQPHTRFRAHSSFSNSRWLLQINPEPRVKVNPRDGEARGLKNGDMVEVFNDRGRFQARYQYAPDVRPGSIEVSEGWWGRYFNAGSMQNVTNDTINPRQNKLIHGPVTPFNDTLVEVKKVEGVK
ncbi:molybdopterin-dependent oxidoreductase [Desulfitobacterium hafniense]|uniref:molybdopterin-dependent oxidoreductase n=1 Tax=Desulfitobacterium hafniense TaxID=49338 RepID=UPI00036270FA|nr:molybdopterin-dependent oxidoreductase [Desulfitobacterium hafniense]